MQRLSVLWGTLGGGGCHYVAVVLTVHAAVQASPGFRLYGSWSLRLELARQAAAAVEFMHSHNVVHRDLTSNNLLVTDKWEAKVCQVSSLTLPCTATSLALSRTHVHFVALRNHCNAVDEACGNVHIFLTSKDLPGDLDIAEVADTLAEHV